MSRFLFGTSFVNLCGSQAETCLIYYVLSIHIIGCHGNSNVFISPCDFFFLGGGEWGRIGESGGITFEC